MPIIDLLTTNTFRDWFLKTNEIIDKLNSGVLVDTIVANGAFVVNGSLRVVNTFIANSTLVLHTGNSSFYANAAVTANCNVWNFACGSLLIQPINGTVVNTAITVNGQATFLNTVFANSGLSIVGDVTHTGNALVNGTLTSNNGPLVARQVLFAASGAMLVPANLASPQYDNYSPAGLNEASILNLTPDIDTVITGIVAPTNFVTGARILYIQNLSPTYNITFVSANTSSNVNNRFKFPNDISTVLSFGTALALIWSSTNKEWRTFIPQVTAFPNLVVAGVTNLTGNAIVGGWLNVVHQLVISGNTALTGNATLSGFANVAGNLAIAGTSVFTGNITAGQVTTTGNLAVTGLTTLTGNLSVSGLMTVSSTFKANTSLGTVGQFLTSGASANAYWSSLIFSAIPITVSAVKSTDFTVDFSSDIYPLTGSHVITLPTTTSNGGKRVTFVNRGTGSWTINCNGAQTLLGVVSYVFDWGQYSSITLSADATAGVWDII